MAFSGTQQKCKACDKTVHFIDMLTADGVSYHKTCFKCSHCNGKLVVRYIFFISSLLSPFSICLSF
jgi:cysteine/glycine-rich protein